MKMYKCLVSVYDSFAKGTIYPENEKSRISNQDVGYYANIQPDYWQLIEETPQTEISIQIPDGFEIDLEKSDLSKALIKFKAIEKEDYEMVAKELFLGKQSFYISSSSGVAEIQTCPAGAHLDPNNSTTADQLQSILDLNRLCNVAKFLNKEWLPNFKNKDRKFHIVDYNEKEKNIFEITFDMSINFGHVYFKTEDLAKKAIKILGEKTIISALTLNH